MLKPDIGKIIKDLQIGGMVVVYDHKDRENEGDVVMSAKFADKEKINFMIVNARGLICAPVDAQTASRLDLRPMVEENSDPYSTNFTVSVDLKDGTHTGISAEDRAKTLMALADDTSRRDDFTRPGHIFPLIGHKEGFSRRKGHTEAALYLMQLAELPPAAVICEILNDDGSMAKNDDLVDFAVKFGLEMIGIDQLVDL